MSHALPNSKALWGTKEEMENKGSPWLFPIHVHGHYSKYEACVVGSSSCTLGKDHSWITVFFPQIPSRCYFPSTEGRMKKKIYIHEGSIPRQLQISKL